MFLASKGLDIGLSSGSGTLVTGFVGFSDGEDKG
jgi:hypothetical protein